MIPLDDITLNVAVARTINDQHIVSVMRLNRCALQHFDLPRANRSSDSFRMFYGEPTLLRELLDQPIHEQHFRQPFDKDRDLPHAGWRAKSIEKKSKLLSPVNLKSSNFCFELK